MTWAVSVVVCLTPLICKLVTVYVCMQLQMLAENDSCWRYASVSLQCSILSRNFFQMWHKRPYCSAGLLVYMWKVFSYWRYAFLTKRGCNNFPLKHQRMLCWCMFPNVVGHGSILASQHAVGNWKGSAKWYGRIKQMKRNFIPEKLPCVILRHTRDFNWLRKSATSGYWLP
jgi:hypothetical protein